MSELAVAAPPTFKACVIDWIRTLPKPDDWNPGEISFEDDLRYVFTAIAACIPIDSPWAACSQQRITQLAFGQEQQQEYRHQTALAIDAAVRRGWLLQTKGIYPTHYLFAHVFPEHARRVPYLTQPPKPPALNVIMTDPGLWQSVRQRFSLNHPEQLAVYFQLALWRAGGHVLPRSLAVCNHDLSAARIGRQTTILIHCKHCRVSWNLSACGCNDVTWPSDEHPPPRSQPARKTCTDCNRSDLHWVYHQYTRWRLANPDHSLHQCREKPPLHLTHPGEQAAKLFSYTPRAAAGTVTVYADDATWPGSQLLTNGFHQPLIAGSNN